MNRSRNKKAVSRRTRRLLPAVAAVGSVCGFATAPASALELGELRMESTLGQPLRASIAYALSPNETLYDFCVALQAPQVGGPIPSVTRASVSVTNNAIILTGITAVKHPLLNLRVAIDCPYTPHLVRDYTMIIDPVLPETRNVAVAAAPSADAPARAATPSVAQTVATPAARPQQSAPESMLSMNSEYRVLNGDTISAIAMRVEGRTIGLWEAVGGLVAANPDAFVGGDVNQLISGSVLFIPDLTEVVAVAEPTPAAAPGIAETIPATETDLVAQTNAFFEGESAESAIADSTLAEPEAVEPTAESIIPQTLPQADPQMSATTATDLPAATDDAVEAEPVADNSVAAAPVETPVAEPVAEPVLEPVSETVPESVSEPVSESGAELAVTAEPDLEPGDIVISAPGETNTQAAVPVVQNAAADTSSGSNWSLIMLLAAGGAALLLAGGVFWGRIRDMFGSRAINAPAPQPESPADEETVTSTIIDDVDFEFNDAVSADAISLDADLDAGTGLQDGGEMDVAQDFGFDGANMANSHVDLELPEEASREPEKHETDIIAPSHKIEESSILEAEVGPSDEDYDMSMIVDATKQRIGEDDLTAQDLRAVPVDNTGSTDEYAVEDDTLVTAMDLEILEQDYEDEFTQTQALSKEMDEAAAELAATLAAQDPSKSATAVDFELEPTGEVPVTADDPGLEPTAEMPARETDLDFELTAEMPAAPADAGVEPTVEMSMTEDDSGTHPELTANIPVDAEALNDDLIDPDATNKLAAAGSDVTVEMEVESGSVDTKKSAD